MPAKNGRGLDEQDCVAPSWRHSRREDNHEALPGSPPNTTGELPLCDDKLLTKRVLREQVYAAANEIRGHPGNDRRKSITCPSYTVYARMEFVARTGASTWRGAVRVAVGGGFAMVITALIGRLLGVVAA